MLKFKVTHHAHRFAVRVVTVSMPILTEWGMVANGTEVAIVLMVRQAVLVGVSQAVLEELVVLQIVFHNIPGVQNVIRQLLAHQVVALGHIILVVLVRTVQVVKLLPVLELLVRRLSATG